MLILYKVVTTLVDVYASQSMYGIELYTSFSLLLDNMGAKLCTDLLLEIPFCFLGF
jgi:hypothetical protein